MRSNIPKDRKPPGPAVWPAEAVPAWVHPVAREYLVKRGLSKAEVERYALHFCDGGDWRNRILIPVPNVITGVSLETFQGRIIDPKYTGKHKYLTAGPRILYVLPYEATAGWASSATSFGGTLWLGEGPFDAWSIARGARLLSTPREWMVGALLGYELSVMQFEQLQTLVERYQLAHVNIWLDEEVIEEAYKVLAKIQPFVSASLVITEGLAKDPGEMTPEQIAEIMKAQGL